MAKKHRPLHSRLWQARTLLKDWKRAIRGSHTVRAGPDAGKITDPKIVLELEDFDDAIQAVTDAIKAARPPRGGGLTQCDMHEDESL